MVFCYWFDKSMCNTIHMVDRVVYSPGDKIEVRSFEGGFFEWKTLILGVNFSNFTVTLT